ncbi:hypothetical protein QL093DRAFT_2491567 [Fusarium oxysporum]|nr:hypothetical protein QL093DRAFT_2491567 [Fusarium oxysporum]
MRSITVLGLSNLIYLFILLPKYRILMGQERRFGSATDEVDTHLKTRRRGIDSVTRRRLVKGFKMFPTYYEINMSYVSCGIHHRKLSP